MLMTTIYLRDAAEVPFPLTCEQFQAALQDRYPQARSTINAVVPDKRFTFASLDLADDSRSLSYFEQAGLVLEDGDGRVWAPVVEWFLSVLPADLAVLMMTEIDLGRDLRLPPRADAAQIAQIYDILVAGYE